MSNDRNGRSVRINCGYRAKVSRAGVLIYPTRDIDKGCSVKLGLGNATFIFNPKKPPRIVRRLISKDSDGTYAPQVDFSSTSFIAVADGVENVAEKFVDFEGNETIVNIKRYSGYREIANSGSDAVSSFIKPTSHTFGRIS